MDDTPFTEEEQIPECIEVKIAYDLSVIPILGVMFYAIFRGMATVKLGTNFLSKSIWLRKGILRSVYFSVIPLVIGGIIFFTVFAESERRGSHYYGCHCGENHAQAMLKAIATSQATYITQYKRYAPSLAVLASSGILQKDGFIYCTVPGRTSDVIGGYTYQMTYGRIWTNTQFYVRCKPVDNNPDKFPYSIDTTGKIVSTESY